MRRILSFIGALLWALPAFSQPVLDPADPIVLVDPLRQTRPAAPASGTVAKWVVGYNALQNQRALGNWTDPFKAYIYNRIPFRLLFPKDYVAGGNSGQKYPLVLMLHGRGEGAGTINGTDNIWDNEFQLRHSAREHLMARNNYGLSNVPEHQQFNGFVLYPQNINGFFSAGQRQSIVEFIQYMIAEADVDPYRITVHGLSAGGSGSWDIVAQFPTVFAAALPMAAVPANVEERTDIYRFIPLWMSSGGLDTSPTPGAAQNTYRTIREAGGNIRWSFYEELGHVVWTRHYAEPDFFPFLERAHKTNPVVLFERFLFCPEDTVDVTLGVSEGFEAYEWRKDGALIPQAGAHTLRVTEYGEYAVRFRSQGVWSPWSLRPIAVGPRPVTQTPEIALDAPSSYAIPAPDGSTSVTLAQPEGFATYAWKRQGSPQVLATTRLFTVTEPGTYLAEVTEFDGCSSVPSAPFTVVDAEGAAPPQVPAGLMATPVGNTSVRLDWVRSTSRVRPPTGFEVYRAERSEGPYRFVALTEATSSRFTDEQLQAGTEYFYRLRAINLQGASATTHAVSARTPTDTHAPTAPPNLEVSGNTHLSISLAWDAATDDVGVVRYQVYLNGTPFIATEGDRLQATLAGLSPRQIYLIHVTALDASGNESTPSAMVRATTTVDGLSYFYYEGEWEMLPDFSTLEPIFSGVTPNVDISIAREEDNFAFKWEGMLNIPAAGTYTFSTISDDGSKLYIGGYGPEFEVVDNDGLHGARERSGEFTFPGPGSYPIVITYFERAGGQMMEVYWESADAGIPRQRIPDEAFRDTFVPPGNPPNPPTQLQAQATAWNTLALQWTDNSDNEQFFQIFRATQPRGPFVPVAVVPADTTVYLDQGLEAATTYYYQVQAVGEFGPSGFSDERLSGLEYRYYEGTWSALPNFGQLEALKQGQLENFSLQPAGGASRYAMSFRGRIRVPATGEYTFTTVSTNGSKLYIGGWDESKLVVNNDGLNSARRRSGTVSLTEGVHEMVVTYFLRVGTPRLDVRWAGPGFGEQAIPTAALYEQPVNATTPGLPAPPSAPTALQAEVLGSAAVQLQWQHTGTAQAFHLYRSAGDTTDFLRIAVLSPDVFVFQDAQLAANQEYFYRVASAGAGGEGSSAPISVRTGNDPPRILAAPADMSMRFNSAQVLHLLAEDPNGDPLRFRVLSPTPFASMLNFSDGRALLSLRPGFSQQGVFPLVLVVTDPAGGADTTRFTLTVNDNFPPVFGETAPAIDMAEGEVLHLPIPVSDPEGEAVQLSLLPGSPVFAQIDTTQSPARLQLTPLFNDAGRYTLNLQATDGQGAISNIRLQLQVRDTPQPNSLWVNFSGGSPAGAPWNNTNSAPQAGLSFGPFAELSGAATPVSLQLSGTWGGLSSSGMASGQGDAPFPDAVLQDSYTFGEGGSMAQLEVNGLDTAQRYEFRFMASSQAPSGPSRYAVSGLHTTLNPHLNTEQTASLLQVQPDPQGRVKVELSLAAGASMGHISALIIEPHYDDQRPPAAPAQLRVREENAAAILSWEDRSINETAFEIFRRAEGDEAFTLLASVGANQTVYADNTVAGNRLYRYQVRAVNRHGASAFAGPVEIRTRNRPPRFTAPREVFAAAGSSQAFTLTARDSDGQPLIFEALKLPNFTSLQTAGPDRVQLVAAPSAQQQGLFFAQITATDLQGSKDTLDLRINVLEAGFTTWVVNFSRDFPANDPWNNTGKAPANGDLFAELQTTTGQPSALALRLTSNWGGLDAAGQTTGQNTGIAPDSVLQEHYWFSNSANMRLEGLKPGHVYRLRFIGSAQGPQVRTRYTVAGKSVLLATGNNTQASAVLTGLVADWQGHIAISMGREGNGRGFLNALWIEEFDEGAALAPPFNLQVQTVSESALNLVWQDGSGRETGFEIYRANQASGPFTRIHTTAANVESYEDKGLARNTVYYYRVRAIGEGNPSDFTPTVAGSTVDFSVRLNFNNGDPAPTPWNNFNSTPMQGAKVTGMRNTRNELTAVNAELTNTWTGEFPGGWTTGDDSGIFPDVVLSTFFYTFPGDPGFLQLSGLRPDYAYDLRFLGSWYSRCVSAYSVGDQTVTQDNFRNTSETVSLLNLRADDFGRILIKVDVAPGSPAAVLNALEILARRAPSPNARQAREAEEAPLADTQPEAQDLAPVAVYPNPFREQVQLDLGQAVTGQLQAMLFTTSGQSVWQRTFNSETPQQHWELRWDGTGLPPGLYILQIKHAALGTQRFKLLKQ